MTFILHYHNGNMERITGVKSFYMKPEGDLYFYKELTVITTFAGNLRKLVCE